MITEKQLREKMAGDVPISRSFSGRLEEVYDQLRRDRQRKEMTMKNKRTHNDRRFWMAVAAAAVMVLCAGSALAYTLTHYDFVNAVWRAGDTEQELTAVEDYILSSGESLELAGYTFTVEEYMLDENGMGFVRYSMENPNGLPAMYDATNGGMEYTGGDSEFWFAPDANGMTVTCASYDTAAADGNTANVHTYVDGVISTETKLYFTDVITFTGEPGDAILMSINLFDENWERTGGTIELTVGKLMPSVEFGDSTGGMRAKLSPFGVLAYGPDYSGVYDLDCLVITCSDGEYTVIDDEQNISARRTATIGLDGDIRVIFDRMVDMGSVESININGYVLTAEQAQTVAFAPEASPVPEIIVFEPDDRSALELASFAENPFHYRRDDGIEVFVLSNDTITAVSDEDIHDYFSFSHGYVSYDDFLANAREDFDEYYASKEFFASSYSASVPDGCMTAQQAIDMYLGILEEYFPGERAAVEYVEATACQSTQEENGAEYVWTLRANVNTMWEAAIDAEKRVLLSPEIVGLNGEWDEQTGEWTSWN